MAASAHFETRELRKLAVDLEDAPAKATKRLVKVVRDNAGAMVVLARANARDTAGDHGKWYARSITSEQHGLTAEVGPERRKRQGGMSFEYGSRNQSSPHLDLNRAADDVFRVFPGQVADAGKVDL